MRMLQTHQQTECRRLLRKAAQRHPEKAIVDRMAKAAEYLDPPASISGENSNHYTYRQGEADSPGHIVYWIESSDNYHGYIDEKDHHAPPFYRVRLGANGDNHSCECKDFANGAPLVNGKKFCKHIMIARTLEHLRDHPVQQKRGIRDAAELMALEQQASAAGIDIESDAVRREFISNPQKFIDLIAMKNGLKPDLAIA